jgi:tetratricopeptide (TPR) repeat protein
MEELKEIFDNMDKSIQMLENMRKEGNLLNESELALSYTNRGILYFQAEMLDEAITDFNIGIEMLEKMASEGKQLNGNEMAKSYACRSMAYNVMFEITNDFSILNQALSDINKSIELWEQLQNSGTPIYMDMLFNMYLVRGRTFINTKEYIDEAISDSQKAIKIAESIISVGEPFDEDNLAFVYMDLGRSYDLKNEFREANKYYNKSIEIWERLKNDGKELSDEGNLAHSYMSRGSNYYSLDENDKAMADHNKCIIIYGLLQKKGKWQDEHYVAMAYRNRALAYQVDRNIKAAVNDNITALQILKEVFSERPEVQVFYYDILNRTIELIDCKNNKVLYDNILQEFLYSLRSVPKEEEAEEAQNNILKELE